MSLALEFMIACILMVIVTTIHGTGISFIDKFFRSDLRETGSWRLARREFTVMVPMALYLLVLHTIEVFVFALFYLGTGDVPTLYDGVYHSGLAYTTMGVIEGEFTQWRVISTFEGLVGFLMIGWSSAVFVTDMERVLRHRSNTPPS